jgi:hypothetical protein
MGKNKKSKSKSYVINGKGYTLLPPCHIGFTEVHEGLFVGKATSVSSVLDKVDILRQKVTNNL